MLMYWYFVSRHYLLVVQSFPSHPRAQAQVKSAIGELKHSPPFLHGPELHSLISIKNSL